MPRPARSAPEQVSPSGIESGRHTALQVGHSTSLQSRSVALSAATIACSASLAAVW